MKLWRKKTVTDELTQDLKKVTEIAGDQIAPGAGTLLLVLAGAAIGAAGAYYVSQKHKNKKAAPSGAASDADRSPLRAKR